MSQAKKHHVASDVLSDTQKWWKEQIIYQIYPRSFKDSTGNGIGDLRGIINKLDYIKNLGVTAVWINPFYASPNDDNGYDISDYRAILPEFGTMQDFDELLRGLHERNIKFVMDLVVNHTSDEHEWFKQAKSSRDNPYRDYYHWWPAEKGKPNFRWSYFDEKGEAWKYDKQTDAYYLHYFSVKQPDLNWENPKVRQEVYNIMKYWAEKGVDGFRLDAFQFVSKDTTFPDLPDSYKKDLSQVIKYHGMGPNLHAYLREMYDEVLSKYDVFAVSEGAGSTFQDAHDLVDEERKELQMAYHFEGVELKKDINSPPSVLDFKQLHSKWDASFAEKGWISIYLANHDCPRMVSRFADDSSKFREFSAKLLNTFLMTMRGTPYCYFGDELGMTNIDFTDISEYQDIAAINGYKKAMYENRDMVEYMQELRAFSRDHSRTPMQWDNSEYAGFSDVKPWLKVNPNKDVVNVKSQDNMPHSVLNHFRSLTKLRTENKTLVYGKYRLLLPEHEHLYAYTREDKNACFLIILNMSKQEQAFDVENLSKSKFNILINSHNVDHINANEVTHLLPYQSMVLKAVDGC